MKTFCKILIVVLFCITVKNSFAQVPQAIPYQGVARKNSGDTYNNQSISLRFSIHNSTANGTIVYSETQGTTTNSLGLFSVNIGEGNPSIGTFSGIDWGVDIKFLQVELDTLGGVNFIDMGTQQMLSVPYALLSGKSADLPSGNSPDDVLIWDGSAWKVIPKCKLYDYYFRDADQDGFGDKYSPVFGCSPLQGFIVDSTDCDDNNSLVTTALTWYQDADGDNFGNISVTQLSCTYLF